MRSEIEKQIQSIHEQAYDSYVEITFIILNIITEWINKISWLYSQTVNMMN